MGILLGLLIAAVILLLLSARALKRRRYLASLILLLLAGLAVFSAYASHEIGSNLQSYHPVFLERDIAEIRVQSAEQGQEVLVRDLVSNRSYRWSSEGSQWKITLRQLQLTGICAIFDWPVHYRLARMHIHSRSAEGEESTIHRVQLHQQQLGWDLWEGTRNLLKKRPDLADEIAACIEAGTLESELLDLPENGLFRASIIGQGLRIRALDGDAGRQAAD